jgi:hypothetical protein
MNEEFDIDVTVCHSTMYEIEGLPELDPYPDDLL